MGHGTGWPWNKSWGYLGRKDPRRRKVPNEGNQAGPSQQESITCFFLIYMTINNNWADNRYDWGGRGEHMQPTGKQLGVKGGVAQELRGKQWEALEKSRRSLT